MDGKATRAASQFTPSSRHTHGGNGFMACDRLKQGFYRGNVKNPSPFQLTWSWLPRSRAKPSPARVESYSDRSRSLLVVCSCPRGSIVGALVGPRSGGHPCVQVLQGRKRGTFFFSRKSVVRSDRHCSFLGKLLSLSLVHRFVAVDISCVSGMRTRQNLMAKDMFALAGRVPPYR